MRSGPISQSAIGELTPLHVNGRFLAQPQSGVQRFATEISRELAKTWPGPVTLLVPRATTVPDGSPLTRAVGRRSGVEWEQGELPRYAKGILLNLGNTAPVFAQRQAVVIHDAGTFATPEAYSCAFRLYYRYLQRLLIRKDVQIISVSEFSRREILRYLGTPRNDIPVVYEGADHMRRLAADGSVLARHGLQTGQYVLAVGNLAKHKNLPALDEAAQQLDARGVPLVITGQLDSGVFRARGSRLPTPARYIGRVSDTELKALYNAAACFVIPSCYEGFGLPAVEAMECRCPVVASAIPALQETCGDAALFCDPASPADIASQIIRVLDTPGLAAALRQAGEVRVQRFTWAHSTRLLAEALYRLAGQSGTSAGLMSIGSA